MNRIIHLPIIALSILLAACSPSGEEKVWNLSTDSLKYSSLLTIARADSFTLVTVKDAWNPERDLHRYVLVPEKAQLPTERPAGTLLRTPLRRAVMHNAVHAALTAELGCARNIAGLCDVDYVQTPELQQLLDLGVIADAGSSVQSDVERYISLRSDAVFTSPLEHANYGVLEKVGIPIVECADYMETSALGRAEWVRFFGLLFDCESRADSLFAAVETRYTALCDSAKQTLKRPRLMVNLINGTAWHMPGGGSYLGQLFADAGADYILAADTRSGSVPLGIEKVVDLAAKADIWLIKQARSHELTYNDLRREHASYATFRPWKERKIFFCNTLTTNYYERTPFHPDVLLQELIYLFHPERATEGYEATFYTPLMP